MSLIQDVRHGVRLARRQPGLTLLAVMALTLGIGLTTLMFSIIQGAILRGLPFADADRIVAVSNTDSERPDITRLDVLPHDFVEWREAQTSFEVFAAHYGGTVNVSGPEGRPERYDGAFMTANGFDVARARPLLGRAFVESDDQPGAEPVVVLGYEVWQTRFGGDPGVVGRTIRVNGTPTVVVGVMPEGFEFPFNQHIWVPLVLDTLKQKRGEGVNLVVFGRLREGVGVDQAQAEFVTFAARQAKEYPETNANRGAVVRPYIRTFFGNDVYQMLYTMLGAVFGVLLIACANVANLLLAKSAVRAREVALRSALGASRRRIVTQLLLETLVLAVVGTVLGLGLAHVGIELFNRSIVDTDPPFWIDIRIDPIVVAFAAGLTLLAAVVSGLMPALQASRADVGEVLKDEGRGTSSLRIGRVSRALVVAEIALSCGLLVAAGLAIRSIVNLNVTNFGLPTEQVLTARLGLFESAYPDAESRATFYADLHRRLQALGPARAAAIATNLPTMGGGRTTIEIEGQTYAADRDFPSAASAVVSPGFFSTFDRAVVRGREFTEADRLDAPRVAIVNDSFAQKYFAGDEPIGRRFRLGRREVDNPWITIVGVAPDLYVGGIENRVPEGFYLALAQQPPRFASLAIRADGDALSLAPAMRQAVQQIDPDLPLYWVRTLATGIAENNWHYRVFGSLFMVFGFVAVFLATAGLYGVMSFSVTRRTQEIGVRMALGADRSRVLRLVFRQGAWQLGLGLALGVVLAGGLSRLLTILLFGIEPWDLATFSSVVVLLAVVALVAILVPARRAMRVEPMTALRYE